MSVDSHMMVEMLERIACELNGPRDQSQVCSDTYDDLLALLKKIKQASIAEAGCETEIDRNVLGTAHSADLAQHRARACRMLHDAIVFGNTALKDQDYVLYDHWETIEDACRDLTDMLDARSNAKDAST